MPSVGSVKRLLQLADCTAILYNILLDVGDDVPDEYLQDIDSDHYWMSEGDGEHHEDHGYVNDKRSGVAGVFKAMLQRREQGCCKNVIFLLKIVKMTVISRITERCCSYAPSAVSTL